MWFQKVKLLLKIRQHTTGKDGRTTSEQEVIRQMLCMDDPPKGRCFK